MRIPARDSEHLSLSLAVLAPRREAYRARMPFPARDLTQPHSQQEILQ